ncbi:MAG TPA: hypothetical protein PLW65_31170 [Pseudomonadota bacterium]|nr:hypothetical protein [Pseudomonadota bacterium]
MATLSVWRRGRPRILGVGLGLVALAACRREPAAPSLLIDARVKPDLSAAAAVTPAVTAALPTEPAAAAAPPVAAPGTDSTDSTDAAVEISGELTLPPGPPPKERLMVYVTLRDCLNDASPLLRRLPASDNRNYFIAVIAPRGSSLSVCAAAEPAPGKPAHLYGRASQTLQLKQTADQSFSAVDVTLAEGQPRRFPSQLAR